ncbi:BREX-1 system phosphatase PglZ type A [Pseudarthrobacter sp. AB1]|uniref:BREX-1 system phosphatase PglZ type A n=1 Tax=Pseudarthrobacter sp. AB1 TaxID=2138309 RepID=UPI00186B6401|nr:BREX-1 system phosphatase PglZ type A [Pseudarthrobacter sp. AB1]MBE4717283.1 BREX-1 system phosphatase PglZ type A [Pseudarthrobacter sp. AB1]
MSVAAIRPHLERRFVDHRVVFWHDAEGQFSSDLEILDLPSVTTVRVGNDEYAIKNRLLHDHPEDKFLVYRSGQVPAGIDNWLLDLELAYGVFTADRSSLVSQDLGLTADGIEEVVGAQDKFFNADKRVQSLKTLLTPTDDAARLRAKMSAVVLGQKEHSLLEITRTLLTENARGQRTKYDALVYYELADFYWRGAASIYGYESASPSIEDFILWMFVKAIDGFKSDRPGGLQNIQLDFASLRNDRRSQEALSILAKRASVDLDYKASIEAVSFRDLVADDLFEETDRKIIVDLARAVTDRTVTAREVADVIRARQSSAWIDGYRQLYTAIGAAAEMLSALSTIDFTFSSFDEALGRYCNDWFRIDQLYRHFTYARRTYEGPHPLDPLREQVEKCYTNKFVYELGNAWQKQVDAADKWGSSALRSQRSFYGNYVEQLVREDKKAVVIISDALRYEVAEELGSRIRQEDRFDADLEAVLGVLPSYTQLGMAALLPHRTLKHSADGKTVLADDQPTNGTGPRSKILETVGGAAVQAEDFKALSPEERRELFKNNRVLYIYHDVIDATGDKPGTERRVFEAAEQALGELVDLVKKAANANATNIFVTADHGFLFQDEALPEHFYLSEKPQGDKILVANRRYVLGHGLKDDPAFTTFNSVQLELDSEIEVQIPKSIHRLKLAGGGSRFVHGGATLQEIVVPVLAVNKKRKSDTRLVNVKVLPDTDKITTGQIVVKLFQSEPASDKVQLRTLRAGLFVGDTLISNDPQPELTFDSTSTEQRDRYQSIQLLLNKDANDYNNRPVEFRLEERIPNTNQWRVYEKAVYTLRRSFTSDFDF